MQPFATPGCLEPLRTKLGLLICLSLVEPRARQMTSWQFSRLLPDHICVLSVGTLHLRRINVKQGCIIK